jgi:hypothetical protein
VRDKLSICGECYKIKENARRKAYVPTPVGIDYLSDPLPKPPEPSEFERNKLIYERQKTIRSTSFRTKDSFDAAREIRAAAYASGGHWYRRNVDNLELPECLRRAKA